MKHGCGLDLVRRHVADVQRVGLRFQIFAFVMLQQAGHRFGAQLQLQIAADLHGDIAMRNILIPGTPTTKIYSPRRTRVILSLWFDIFNP
ncbi:hypothetical protein D3C84_1150600 [compost metagenome]